MTPRKKPGDGTTGKNKPQRKGTTGEPRQATPKEAAYRGERRAEAARKSWETRRARDLEREPQTYEIPGGGDEDERGTGENLWTFYDDLKDRGSEQHDAVTGIAKDFLGSKVRVKLSGRRQDPLTKRVSRWTRSAVVQLDDVEQLIGGGSVTLALMKDAKRGSTSYTAGERPREESEDEIWATSMSLEFADEFDEIDYDDD